MSHHRDDESDIHHVPLLTHAVWEASPISGATSMKIHKRLRAVVSQTTSRYLLEHIALEDVRPTTNTGGGNPAGNGSAQQQTGTVPEGAEGATSEANKGVDVELREAYKSYQVSYIS